MFKFKKQFHLYTCSQITQFIDAYMAKVPDAIVATIEEGCLGFGLTILHDPEGKWKTAVIKEKYINCWSSGHTIRMYNKCPEKYMKWIEENV